MKFMQRLIIVMFVVLGMLGGRTFAEDGGGESVQWGVGEAIPALPDTLGFGGPLVGVDGSSDAAEALIVAGGANFPGVPAWQGGPKVWYDQIYVLESGQKTWDTRFKLPHGLAYGGSVNTSVGMLILGGSDAEKVYDEVLALRWKGSADGLEIQSMPSLPRPSAYLAAEVIGEKVYVIPGKVEKDPTTAITGLWMLDLGAPKDEWAWVELAPMPGPPRQKVVTAVQSFGKGKQLFAFSGQETTKGADGAGGYRNLTDAYRYDPATDAWTQLADLPALEERRDLAGKENFEGDPTAITAGVGMGVGQSHVLLMSGSTGRYAGLPVNKRPLFPNQVLAYHTFTDNYAEAGQMPRGIVTTRATMWEGRLVIPSGEVRPGIRSAEVMVAKIGPRGLAFGIVNYGVLGLYLVVLVAMGAYFSRGKKNSEDFFLAGRRIPWWAAGISIYGTQLSAITFISIPATAFAGDWRVAPGTVTIFLMAPVVVFLYLPFFRRLNVTTAYEYLEKRFSLGVRLYGSLSFVAFQLARMAIVIYLPALALTAITGIDVYVCIVLMGLLATAYTVLGGMEAVVWTDVLQVIVLLGGLIISLVLVLGDVGGVNEVMRVATEDGKMAMFNWEFNWVDMTTWAVFFGSFALQFGPYTTDQAVIQRYLTTKDEKSAARGVWLNGLVAVPFSFAFFALGTCLYVYFKTRPESLMVGMPNDQIFPLYIAQRLPIGISGLVIAGVFAASMSSLDSSMHSISTALTTDFYKRLKTNVSDEQSLKFARRIIIGLGFLAVVMACVLVTWDFKTLFLFFQKVLGLISSGLVGMFILGIFTKQANGTGAIVGAVSCTGLLAYLYWQTDVHYFLYGLIGISTCVVVGYVVSVISGGARGDLAGVTWATRLPEELDEA